MLSLKKFGRKIKKLFGTANSFTVHTNNHVDIIHRACKICVRQPLLNDFDKRLEYIDKVVRRGHESTLEHSNVVILLEIPNSNIIDFIKLEDSMRYLRYKIVTGEKSSSLLIGGSIRGYKHVIKNVKDLDNIVIKLIKQELYNSTYSEYYKDIIDAGVMEKSRFIVGEKPTEVGDLYYDEKSDMLDLKVEGSSKLRIEEFDIFNIINMDNIEDIYNMVKDYGFTYEDLLDICTITIEFKNISRAISQQLTRHRAAISQESQRYVNYSDMRFINPVEFKEKYKDKNFIINGKSLDEYSKENIENYSKLISLGLDKEDARGFLFFNVETKLMMTFTFRDLIKFLELRTHISAQAEIRSFAIEIERYFINMVQYYLSKDIYLYLLPKYVLLSTKYNQDLEDESNYTEDIGKLLEEEIIREDKENGNK